MNGSPISPRKIGGWLILVAIRIFAALANALFAVDTMFKLGYRTDMGIMIGALLIIGAFIAVIALFFFFKRYKYFKGLYIALELYFALFNFAVFPVWAGIAASVWAFVFIFCMLLSRRARQTFVYDWDGIPDRACMEKAGLMALPAAVPGGRPPDVDERRKALEQREKKTARKQFAGAYIASFIVLAAAVALYFVFSGTSAPAAGAGPSPAAYASAEPAEPAVTSAVAAQPQTSAVASAEASASYEPQIPEEGEQLGFDAIQENFNNNALVKSYGLYLEAFEPEDDPDNISIIESWLGEGGDCFVGDLSGMNGYIIAQYTEDGASIDEMAFFCEVENQYKEVMVRALSLCFITSVDPKIQVGELEHFGEYTKIGLYGVEYKLDHIEPEEGNPYYVTTAAWVDE